MSDSPDYRPVIFITEADANLKCKSETIVATTSQKTRHKVPYTPLQSVANLAELLHHMHELWTASNDGNTNAKAELTQLFAEVEEMYK